MNDVTYSLNLSGFSIEFDVKTNESLELTRWYDLPSDNEFVFAVANTWLKVGQDRYLLASEFHTGNLIELLRGLEEDFGALSFSSGIERVIARCGWARSLHGYWERLMHDSSLLDDETLYQQLIPMLLMEGLEGYIGAYRYNDSAIIEAATRPKSGTPIFVCSDFNPEEKVRELVTMRALVQSDLAKSMGSDFET